MSDNQIHRVGAILIKDKKLLVSRDADEDYFKSPGGKVDPGETPESAIIRELKEEVGLNISTKDLQLFGTFYVDAHDNSGLKVRMDTFLVNKWSQEPKPASDEIADITWITHEALTEMKLGKVFQTFVIPELKKKGLID
jgi:8-oxo-dGTP diphosphatase